MAAKQGKSAGDWYWIVEVNGNPPRWAWRAHVDARGDVRAFCSRAEAKVTLYEARQLYGNSRLAKFVREVSQ